MIGLGQSTAGGSGVPLAEKSVTVPGLVSTPLFTVVRLLGSASALALSSGTNANLSINGTTGVVSGAAPIGAGSSQIALVQETLASTNGNIVAQYPIVLTGAAVLGPLSVPTAGAVSTPLAISGASIGSTITSPDAGSHAAINSGSRQITFDAAGTYIFTLAEALSGYAGRTSGPFTVTIA